MMSNNKILTVSYGTFSCTLEGFDDSFGTMKAIAEYFRDLAADDRYFGAEPPQPDAEMLARIAEREISRRVEAREQEGRIVLSAEPEAAPGPHTAPAALAVASVAAAAPEVVAPQRVDDAETETIEPALSRGAVATADADEVLDIADDGTDEIHVADVEPDDVAGDDTSAVPEDVADETPGADAPVEAPEALDSEALDSAEAFFADSDDMIIDASADDEMVDAEPVTTPDAPAPDSIAAKLQRIRAVVSQSTEDDDEDLVEDEHAEAFTPTAEAAVETAEFDAPAAAEDATDTLADALAALEDASDVDAEAEHATAQAEDDGDDLADILAQYDADASDNADHEDELAETSEVDAVAAEVDAVPEIDVPALDTTEHDTAETEATDPAEILLTEDHDLEFDFAETASVPAEPEHNEASAAGIDTLAADLDLDTSDTDAGENLFGDDIEDDVEDAADDAASEAAPGPAPRRARIIKVKRADIDAALASGQIEEITDEGAEDDTASSLSDEEEAELQAELAAVAAELPETDLLETGDSTDAFEDDDDFDDLEDLADLDAMENVTVRDADTIDAGAAADTPEQQVADADVSRLMAEADSQMEEPEGTRRRNAFQHLKAAVMAKKADAAIGDDTVKDEGAFRSDLESVVVPRRPTPQSAGRDARPASERPAPLKLVAEQRVDIEGAAPSGPVRPRRVAQAEMPAAPTAADGSFADYAADMGAHSLPDLLEAAASYLSFVEGHDQFSRPQLMTKVRQVEKEDFSREDGLRSFGQLLRAGKIQKRKGGRFTVTGDIGYRPDERAAG